MKLGVSLGVLLLVANAAAAQPTFQINTLTNNNVTVVDAGIRGDSRGGVAVSTAGDFTTGDGDTARFTKSNLTGGATLGVRYDALISDVATNQVYVFGTGPVTPVTNNAAGSTWSHIIAVNDNGTLGTATALSTSIAYTPAAFNGLFSGYGGYGLVFLANEAGGTVRRVDYATGAVTTLKTGYGSLNTPGNEANISYGVAEFFGGEYFMVGIGNDSDTRIDRRRVSDGNTTTLAIFPGQITDDLDLTVDVAAGRWYWNAEADNGAGFTNLGGNENIGFASATFTISAVPEPATMGLAAIAGVGAVASGWRRRTIRRKRTARPAATK